MGIVDGQMDEEDVFFFFFLMGWVSGWQYSSVDLFSLLVVLGEDCCCTLLIDLIERLARPIFP